MKKNILFLITLVFMMLTGFGQINNLECGAEMTLDSVAEAAYRAAQDQNAIPTWERAIFNIYFWVIYDHYGSNNSTTEEDILQAVANINIEYNKHDIFFKYKGFSSYNHVDPAYTPDIHTNEYEDEAELYAYRTAHGYKEPNSFNIYIPHSVYGIVGSAGQLNTEVIIVDGFLQTYAPIHEIGHCFNLLHPFQQYGGEECEHVTRDPLDLDDPNDPYDTYFNAKTRGDRMVGTAATLETQSANNYCDYTGNGHDCQGSEFNIYQSDIRNYMGYFNYDCKDRFTDDQVDRMRYYITQDRWGHFADAETTVEALYEHYAGEYYNTGPHLPEHTPLFQPGFDYYFVECFGYYPQPSAYDDISFSYDLSTNIAQFSKYETDFGSIIHPNHSAIRIEQLEPPIQPRKCYNNWYRVAIGGSITKFNDDIINNNITLTPKDSLSINDQNLIQNLQNGLYKIDKQYNDGSTEQQVIIKE